MPFKRKKLCADLIFALEDVAVENNTSITIANLVANVITAIKTSIIKKIVAVNKVIVIITAGKAILIIDATKKFVRTNSTFIGGFFV